MRVLQLALRGVAFAVMTAVAVAASAQNYPAKPVRIVVPFGAGGPADLYARFLAQQLQQPLGQNIIVENRPGAGSIIGTDVVAKSPADGYTLLLMSNTHTVNESLIPKKPFTLMKDFAPVAPINYSDLILVVHPSLPVNSVKELIALARARPGQLNFSTGPTGGSSGIAGEWPELKAYPDFGVLRDAMRIVRKMNREEDIDFVYFGGVRSGTDVAKLIGLGAKAGAIGLTVGMALGGEMVPGGIAFFGDRTEAERADGAASIINAMSAEASIMARCTGKTDVRNIEPEDLRAITLALRLLALALLLWVGARYSRQLHRQLAEQARGHRPAPRGGGATAAAVDALNRYAANDRRGAYAGYGQRDDWRR